MNGPILLVEDEVNNVFLMKHAFKAAGIVNPLHVAIDGKEAMDYLGGPGPDGDSKPFPRPVLTLLDLKLPRVTGLEVLKWMREQPELKSLVVLILTSSQMDDDIARAYRLGANAYLVKPSTPDELSKLVTRIKQFWLELNLSPGVGADSANFRGRVPDNSAGFPGP